MRAIVGILILAVVLVSLGLVLSLRDGRDLTTTSDEAYKEYQAGEAHLTAFQFDQGVARLERALALDPRFAMAAAALAQGYAQTGRGTPADSLLTVANRLAAEVEDPVERMLVQLRLADLGLKSWAAVRDSLHQALVRSDPDDIILLNSLAAEARRNNDSSAAERYYRRILDQNPNYAAAYNNLGYLEFHRGNVDEAVDLLQRYAFLAPDLANPYDSLGEVYLESGRYAEAELQFRHALSLQRDYLPSLLNLGNVYFAQGQLRKGADLFAQVDRQMAGTPLAAQVRGNAVRSLLRYELLSDLQALAPDFAADPIAAKEFAQLGHAYNAVQLQQQGRPEEAAAFWQAALAQGQDSRTMYDLVPIREKLASCLAEAGRPTEALEQTALILELNPRNHLALATAAAAQLALGRADAARAHLDRLDESLAQAEADESVLAAARALRGRLALLAGTP